jgi:hypothetical protein
MVIKIAKDLSLPLDAVTQSIGILAKRRAGKSYTMRKVVEELLRCNQQVVLVDPKGDQWGIRSAANGKDPGYSIIILGGEHQDVPLEVNSGEIVAKLVVEEHVSILLDLSLFRKHEVSTFMTSFLENLYRLKAKEKYRTPMMLVVDEADAIAPQRPQKGEERMLGAIEDVVRRGGQRGIGCCLITQRSAVLNKNVLTQIQILITLRTIAPQDLAAMNAWIEVHGTIEQQKTLMGSLPSLPTGDAWFWSPGWPTEVGIFQRSHVLPITTFDSGATPKPGEKRVEPKKAAEVDLEALRRQMEATIERSKQNDPSELKKRIRQLEQEIKVNTKATILPSNEYLLKLEEKIRQKLLQEFVVVDKQYNKIVEQQNDKISRAIQVLGGGIQDLKLSRMKECPSITPISIKEIPERRFGVIKSYRRDINNDISGFKKDNDRINNGDEIRLRAGVRRMLEALVQWSPEGMAESQMRSHAGLKKSGTYSAYMTDLRHSGFIEERNGLIYATSAGITYIGHDIQAPTNTQEVMDIWLPKLRLGARRMLECLVSHMGEYIPDEQLQQEAELANSGTYSSYKTDLRTARLIKSKAGLIAADKETLFL